MTRFDPDVPIGVLYEHPLWFEPLFDELDRRGIPFDRIDASQLSYDPVVRSLPYSVVLNRMSPSAWLRGDESSVFSTLNYLGYLEDIGTPVINGRQAFSYEISKARQIALASELGIRHPRARVITHPGNAVEAADGLQWPVLVKPNIGGSGAGITEHQTPAELAAAVEAGLVDDLGPDGTGLVQEKLAARDNSIVRVEILNGNFLYAIRLQLIPGSFNLCPADYCDPAQGIADASDLVKGYTPPDHLIDQAARIIEATGADLGGVEYLVSDFDGEAYFYDINVLSNFVADAANVVGFDPFVQLADFIEDRANRRVLA